MRVPKLALLSRHLAGLPARVLKHATGSAGLPLQDGESLESLEPAVAAATAGSEFISFAAKSG
jgi:hypothetical protein